MSEKDNCSSSIQVFANGDDVVYWGDALEVLREAIPNGTVDLIFADPPYNLGKQFSTFADNWASIEEYVEWCHQWLMLCIKKLKPSGSLYVMNSTQVMPYLDIFLRNYVHIMSRIVWYYDSSGVQARKYFGSRYEPILFCVMDKNDYIFNADDILVAAKTGSQRQLIDYRKPIPTTYNTLKVPGNVWEIPRVRYRMSEYENHPSQKPEALLERIILASSNAGDSVLDPFSGTFTTSAVAQRLGRNSMGIEREIEYVKIGLRRLGIQREYDGIPLEPPRKTYVRRNGQKKDQNASHDVQKRLLMDE